MTLIQGFIAGDQVKCSAQTVDIADRHGVRKPFLLIVTVESHQICIERCNRGFAVFHFFFCIITHHNKSKTRRCRDCFLGTAAEKIDLKVIDTDSLAKHTGNRVNDR